MLNVQNYSSSLFSSQLSLVLQRRELPQKVTWALITTGVMVQVQLMVLFRIPPLACWQNLRRNTALPPLLVNLVRHVPRNLLLLGIVVKNCRSVLSANIRALAICSRRIMHLIEKFQQVAICDFLGVIDYLQCLGIYPIRQLLRVLHCKQERRDLRPVRPLHTALYPGFSMSPPMYPTRASYRPLPLYSRRYMCSTPQKQPAATVAVCAPAGTVMGCAGALDIVVKGRKSLVRKDMER